MSRSVKLVVLIAYLSLSFHTHYLKDSERVYYPPLRLHGQK